MASPVRLSVSTTPPSAAIHDQGRAKVPEPAPPPIPHALAETPPEPPHMATTETELAAVQQHQPPADRSAVLAINSLAEMTQRIVAEKAAQDQVRQMIAHAQMARDCIRQHYARVQAAGGEQQEQGLRLSCRAADAVESSVAQVGGLMALFLDSSEFRRWLGDLVELGRDVVQSKLASGRRPSAMKRMFGLLQPNKTKSSSVEHQQQQQQQSKHRVKKPAESPQKQPQPMAHDHPEEFVGQLRQLCEKLHRNPRFREGFLSLLDNAAPLAGAVVEPQPQDAEVEARRHLNSVYGHARQAIEQFAGGFSTAKLAEAMRELSARCTSDNQAPGNNSSFGAWCGQLGDLLRLAATDPVFLGSDEFTKMAGLVVEGLQPGGDSSESELVHTALDQLDQLMDGVALDQLLRVHAPSWDDAQVKLFLDESGMPTLKPAVFSSVNDLFGFLCGFLKDVRFEDISQSDDRADFLLQGICPSTNSLIADNLKVKTKSHWNAQCGFESTSIVVRMLNVHLMANNVRFHYTDKRQSPKLTEGALVDLVMPDRGLEVTVELRVEPARSTDRVFRVMRVLAHIHHLTVNVHAAEHELAYSMFTAAVKRHIRENLESQISQQIDAALSQFEHELGELRRAAAVQQQERVQQLFEVASVH